MQAIRLRTEYLKNPLGIDIKNPRLFWNCVDGIKQVAYQVICKDEYGNLLWDTGKVSGNTMCVSYQGKPLKSRMRIIWSVRIWDEQDKPGQWSEEAFFEMGLFFPEDWKAKWITGKYKVNRKLRYPVDCFKKVFSSGKVKKARLYATACGLYHAMLNGKQVGNIIMAPGITDYRKRVQYQIYDVTDLLIEGDNELTVQLADGWYRGSCGSWGIRNQYGTRTKLLVQLELTYNDGTVQTIVTDESWQWSNDGPIRFADNKDGEIVEASMKPSYGGKAKCTKHMVVPTLGNNVPVLEHEQFSAKLITTPKGNKVLDFGQNMAGYISFKLNAKAGQVICLRFGELIDSDGEFTQKNIQLSSRKKTTPLQQVKYICRDGVNFYKTTFAYFGFRYVQIDTEVPFSEKDFTAIAVYSDLEPTGKFCCSNELINRFVECTIWSTKSNSLDLPTDCPTRERHGWSGDAQIFFDTASYLFNYNPFARKYLNDMYDWQRKDGCLPHIAPDGGADFYMYTMNGSTGWSDAGILIPYRMWKKYGDDAILINSYEQMRRYTKFLIKRCGGFTLLRRPIFISRKHQKYLVNRGQSYGEWAEPDDVRCFIIKDFIFPHPEESTAYTTLCMEYMAEIAQYLGKKEDADIYSRYADGCRAAYQELVEKKGRTLDTDRQAKLVRPLKLNLLNDRQKEFAKQRLITAMENYRWRVGTGFLSTPFILYVLADINIDYAYRLLENEECPGWLFIPKSGATTVWEAWEGNSTYSKGIASLNHYSKGAMVSWLFDTACGINVNGKNHFLIAPKPGGTLTFAEAEYNSQYGTVCCRWEKENSGIYYKVIVPANTEATFVYPSGKTVSLGPGIHSLCK